MTCLLYTSCMGSGAKSKSDIKSCPHCNGTGTVTTQQRTPFGVFQSQSVCPDCNGTGKTIVNKMCIRDRHMYTEACKPKQKAGKE